MRKFFKQTKKSRQLKQHFKEIIDIDEILDKKEKIKKPLNNGRKKTNGKDSKK